jgi:hypothetical protein
VVPHTGPTNKKLRVHIPLVVRATSLMHNLVMVRCVSRGGVQVPEGDTAICVGGEVREDGIA